MTVALGVEQAVGLQEDADILGLLLARGPEGLTGQIAGRVAPGAGGLKCPLALGRVAGNAGPLLRDSAGGGQE